MEEIWRPIKDFEGLYEISNLGRVKSLEKKFKGKCNSVATKKERIVKKTILKGYERCGLIKGEGRNNIHTRYIHRLVAIAFIQNPNNLPQINHINKIKNDNKVENLEWVTSRENSTHRSTNKSGFCNVRTRSKSKAWCFQIHLNGKNVMRGYFKTPEEAHAAHLKFLSDNNITNKYASA